MRVFVHDPRVKLEITGPPGPVIVPEPPYWFGKKARRPPFLLPREFPARLTIPSDCPPGVVTWQVANANGASAVGRLVIGTGPEVIEVDGRTTPQDLESLPVTVSGQIRKIEEVDRYRFTATKAGLVTCRVVAPAIGSDLSAVIEVHDGSGRLVADAADTAGDDLALTFPVRAGETYTVSLYDLDFRGNRAFVYRLSLADGPRVVAAIPPTAAAGTTQKIEFVGYGIATGQPTLESLTREVTFPAGIPGSSFDYSLETPHGTAAPFRLHTTSRPKLVEPAGDATRLVAPVLVTGVLDERFGEDRYSFTAKKGESLSIRAIAREIGSRLDMALAVFDAEGKELARSDDRPDSTDAALEFTAKADGEYTIGVSDISGRSGDRTAVYQLELAAAEPGFALTVPEMLAAPIGGKVNLSVRVTRTGGFKDAIPLTIEGLPAGITLPESLQVAAGQAALNVELNVSADAAATASPVRVVGTATVGGKTIQREAGPTLVAITIPPPFVVDAEGQDDVTKWPRGTTFPAPVLIERSAGFDGEIVLEMTSKQGRHRQGIRGPELTVPPGVGRVLYPVFLPEWLETTRTSRMVVNGVAQVKDPQGNVRYSLVRQKTRMGFLPVGALLKLAADPGEVVARPGGRFVVPVSIARSRELTEPLRLELSATEPASSAFAVEPITLEADESTAEVPITVTGEGLTDGEYRLTLRATTLQNGQYPVVSEASFIVRIDTAPTAASRASLR
jgi:hypothetical protein